MIYVGARSAFLFIGTRAEWEKRQQDVFERMMKRKRDILHVRELAYRREYNRPDCDLKTLKQLKQKVILMAPTGRAEPFPMLLESVSAARRSRLPARALDVMDHRCS